MTQKVQQKNFKLIKIRDTTKNELDNLIEKIEKKQPYLKNCISYNSILLMLLNKNKIKLSKYTYLKKKR